MARALAAGVLLAFAMACLVPLAASADTALRQLTLRQQMLGWEAVGRLDIGTGGFCSGALIAPDLVLTAAHCLVSRGTGARVEVPEIRFRAALVGEVALAERRGLRAVMHPDYDPADQDWLRQLRSDVALVQLDSPIPAAEADPFALGAPVRAGGRVSVVSYARGRTDALGWQRGCTVQGTWQGAIMMNCDTDFGASGAPVFELSAGRPRIVSIISRGRRDGGEVQVWGMEIAGPLAEVRRALASGRGVWPEGQVQARRLRVGSGGGASGARFVRP